MNFKKDSIANLSSISRNYMNPEKFVAECMEFEKNLPKDKKGQFLAFLNGHATGYIMEGVTVGFGVDLNDPRVKCVTVRKTPEELFKDYSGIPWQKQKVENPIFIDGKSTSYLRKGKVIVDVIEESGVTLKDMRKLGLVPDDIWNEWKNTYEGN